MVKNSKIDKALSWLVDACANYEDTYKYYGYPLASLEGCYEILKAVKLYGSFTCLLLEDDKSILKKFNIPYKSSFMLGAETIYYC